MGHFFIHFEIAACDDVRVTHPADGVGSIVYTKEIKYIIFIFISVVFTYKFCSHINGNKNNGVNRFCL